MVYFLLDEQGVQPFYRPNLGARMRDNEKSTGDSTNDLNEQSQGTGGESSKASSSTRQICYQPKGHDEGETPTEHVFEDDRGPIEDESRYCMVSD